MSLPKAGEGVNNYKFGAEKYFYTHILHQIFNGG